MDYKVEIIINSEEPKDITSGIGRFARVLYETFFLSKGKAKLYTFSVEPIDREKAEYKFIKDMDK